VGCLAGTIARRDHSIPRGGKGGLPQEAGAASLTGGRSSGAAGGVTPLGIRARSLTSETEPS